MIINCDKRFKYSESLEANSNFYEKQMIKSWLIIKSITVQLLSILRHQRLYVKRQCMFAQAGGCGYKSPNI